MKTTLTTACVTTLLILGNLSSAQTTALNNTFDDPNHEAPPPTTKMRVESLKTRHTESLSTLTAALNRISGDPALVTAKETFAAVDRADRDMQRSKSASESIIADIRSEFAAIKGDSAFGDDQKAELEAAAKALAEECDTVRKEAHVVIKNLGSSSKKLAQWKKLYKSYLNLQGENQAKKQLTAVIEVYAKGLTQSPTEAKPAEDTASEKESP